MSQEVLILLSPLIAAIVVISVLGWTRVPAQARFRGRLGISGPDFTVGKGAGFGMRLASSLFIYFGAAAMGSGGTGVGTAVALGAIGLVVMLIGQISAIRRAAG